MEPPRAGHHIAEAQPLAFLCRALEIRCRDALFELKEFKTSFWNLAMQMLVYVSSLLSPGIHNSPPFKTQSISHSPGRLASLLC